MNKSIINKITPAIFLPVPAAYRYILTQRFVVNIALHGLRGVLADDAECERRQKKHNCRKRDRHRYPLHFCRCMCKRLIDESPVHGFPRSARLIVSVPFRNC